MIKLILFWLVMLLFFPNVEVFCFGLFILVIVGWVKDVSAPHMRDR